VVDTPSLDVLRPRTNRRRPGKEEAVANDEASGHVGPRIAAALVVLLTAAVYIPSLGGGFFSDDFVYVVGNDALRSIPVWRLWSFFGGPTNPYEFLPIRDMSYRFDIALFGLNPLGYHLHNLLLYALGCVAAWLCCRAVLALSESDRQSVGKLTVRPTLWICAAATALFAVHPAHVESVAWVSGRKDLLSGLFALLSLWQFAHALLPEKPKWHRLVTASALFTLALMSKSTALPVVLVALLLALTRYRHRAASVVRAVAPIAAIAGLWLAVVLRVGRATGVRLDPFRAEIVTRSWYETGPEILGHLARIAMAPLDLRLVYDVGQSGWTSRAYALAGALVVVAAVAGAIAAWRRRSAAGFGVVWFLAFCLPYLQIIPFTTWSLVSERFLFLPIFGLTLTVASLLARAGKRWMQVGGAALTVVGLALTLQQANLWSSKEALISATAERSPESNEAQKLLVSQVLVPAGRYSEVERATSRLRNPVFGAVLRRYARAWQALREGDDERAFDEARGLDLLVDHRSDTYLLLLTGRVAEAGGDEFEAARRYYQASRRSATLEDMNLARDSLARIRERHEPRLVEMRKHAASAPEDVVRQGNLANLEMELFLLEDAAARYRAILEVHPRLAVARYNLGLTLSRQQRYRDAAVELRRAIEDGMESPNAWNNLAIALKEAGRLDEAKDALRRALQSDPRHCHAAINLGRLHLALREVPAAQEVLSSVRDGACPEMGFVIDLYLEQAQRMNQR
jgi:tetratricopeptide (TPR) repeat protein